MKKKLLILIIIAAAILAFFVIWVARNEYLSENHYYIGNLHTHTYASDGKMTYREVIEKAKSLGFDFIAITDHNTISLEVTILCPQEKMILCIIGEEVSSKEGHILAIGIYDIIPKDLSAEETIRVIHEQGGLAIPAHPEAPNGLRADRIKELQFDAVECNARHKKEGDYTCKLVSGFPYVYNSDAHKLEELSLLANRCRMGDLTLESLKEAIKKGDCSEIIL